MTTKCAALVVLLFTLMLPRHVAGGTETGQPEDHGFMYQHGFADPDGHIWEVAAQIADGGQG